MEKRKYTVVIIDDESICIENIKQSMTEFPELILVGTAQTADEGKNLILEQHPDLLFLDVELPGQTGLELLNDLCGRITWSMQVVIHTAYEKYLLDALRASAFDCLLKPYDQAEFKLVMNRFFNHITKEPIQNSFKDTLLQLSPITSFTIATVTGYQILRLEQIGYFEYQKGNKQWTVILSDKKTLQLKRCTSADDILSYASSFIQINQQQIINIDYLSGIEGRDCKLLPPFDDEKSLTISRTFLRALQEKFFMI